MKNFFNLNAETSSPKLSRGRLTSQGITFLRTLDSYIDPKQVQRKYYEKFGVMYRTETLMKYVPKKATMLSSKVDLPYSGLSEFKEGQVTVSPSKLTVNDYSGNSVEINIELFTPEAVQQLSSQILYQLEDELKEEETVVEKLKKKINAIKTLLGE